MSTLGIPRGWGRRICECGCSFPPWRAVGVCGERAGAVGEERRTERGLMRGGRGGKAGVGLVGATADPVGVIRRFNVVKAYSIYDEEVGYTQGLQFIVGPLLLNVSSHTHTLSLSLLRTLSG